MKTEDVSIRVQPHSPEAEQAVLGTFFFNNEAIVSVQSVLEDEDFYDPRHQEIYRVVQALDRAGTPLDQIVLIQELDRLGTLERCGGAAYVAGLEQAVISPGNVLYHARIVADHSARRQVIRMATEATEAAYAEQDAPLELLAATSAEVDKIHRKATRESHVDMQEVVQRLYEEFIDPTKRTPGLKSGLSKLDWLTGGWRPGQLIVVAGGSSAGKSAIALQFALAAAGQGAQTLFFSLEMDPDAVGRRAASILTGIDHDVVRRGSNNTELARRVKEAWEQVRDSLILNVEAGISCDNLLSIVQKEKMAAQNLGLVVVDYLQLLGPRKQEMKESRERKVAGMGEALKILARELAVPVVLLSQINKEGEKRKSGEPAISDLRESAATGQHADAVLLLHRVGPVTIGDKIDPNMDNVLLILGKQRDGPVGRIPLIFRKDTLKFHETDRPQKNRPHTEKRLDKGSESVPDSARYGDPT